ncbi:hypothetical protein AXG93_4625s1070 [Marchantia polymorpha subsp. ruderalis]|uniref:Uncharacterized protein n=1 Tax=Marchantia polymorpha subsp. ruderalis TaxID=1480154 RepID=A0A176VUE1_MARPO|nr:hypothetical protein AXG93_4625s1070 [Marchantia polymorpha subsp. ruderalis]
MFKVNCITEPALLWSTSISARVEDEWLRAPGSEGLRLGGGTGVDRAGRCRCQARQVPEGRERKEERKGQETKGMEWKRRKHAATPLEGDKSSSGQVREGRSEGKGRAGQGTRRSCCVGLLLAGWPASECAWVCVGQDRGA